MSSLFTGDFDEATYHLQIVMNLTPDDATAIARSALINAKMNRFTLACQQIIKLSDLDRHSFAYVLKTVDQGRRTKVADVSECNTLAIYCNKSF